MSWRSVGAVLAGFVSTAVLSVGTDAALEATGVFPPGRLPDSLFVVAAIYRALYTVLGGFVTTRLAPDRPWRHAVALMVLGGIGGTLGLLGWFAGGPELGPFWYAASIPASAVPCIALGARLARA